MLMACLSVCISASGQSSNFINYGVEDGLVQSQVQTINQDASGNLWIGTISGVSCYNGLEFKSIKRKDGLAEDWITSSCLDKSGNLWFGHWGGGVSFYETKSGEVRNMAFETYSKYKSITAILEDGAGSIWFATEGGGIFKYLPGTEEPTGITTLNSVNFTSLALDKAGNIWAGSPEGISIIEVSGGKLLKELKSKNGIDIGSVNAISNTLNGEMWVATNSQGIIRFKVSESGTIENEVNTLNIETGLPTNEINVLYADSENNIWIGTEGMGIVQFIPFEAEKIGGGFAKGELNAFSNRLELKYYQANVFFEDREKSLWMGTDIGLNQYKGELFRIYNSNDGLANTMVWSILCDHNESVWIGSNDGVTHLTFNISSSGKRHYNSPNSEVITTDDGLPDNTILTLYEDDEGLIWMGTESNGACSYNPENGAIKKYNEGNGLESATIFSISSDKKGNIWFGTRNGAYSLNKGSGKISNLTVEDGLGGNKVYKLFNDSKGNLWMGILGGYLTRYDGQIFKTYGKADGLDVKFILNIAEDKSGNIWLGSYGSGIYKFDGSSFTNYSTAEGLSSETPNFLISDDAGDIWIGMNQGMEKFVQSTQKFVRYSKNEGFHGIETNQNAVSKDGLGNIWFGTIRGAVKLSPGRQHKNTVEPITTITSMEIYLKETPFPESNTFNYDQSHLTFNFIAVSLSNPELVRYSYFLDGFDKDWSPPSLNNKVTYSNVPPGSYTLRVKAANSDEVWNVTEQTYAFTITPPFWMTWWFYASCSITAIALIFSFIKIRERSLKQRQKILEEQVEERTTEVREEQQKVAKKNKQIMDSINYAQKIQTAILPSKELIEKELPESFILFKPKDIVSGDFYWMDKKANKILVSAVDCTGHGVPGAFMSLIGHNLLDKIVNELNITQPSKILTELNKEVNRTFERQNANVNVKDGMDMALCSIDLSAMKLEYSGAYNSVYLVRDGQIHEFSGDKIPIGKMKSDLYGDYKNQEYDLKKGDTIYMSSDGYPDQRGGPKNKKFFYPPFRDLLVEVSKLPMKEQEMKLDDTITSWMNNKEQIDDILIFGIRI